MAKIEKRRARRLRLTQTVAERRLGEHLRNHGSDPANCACAGKFAKRSAFECGCRKRRKGNPRVAAGMCDIGNRDRIYTWRRETRELRLAVVAGRELDGGIGEAEHRWPGAKAGPKPFTVEERSLDRKGNPVGDWSVIRRYRTAADRNNAIRGLRHQIRSDTGTGRSPRSEFRISSSNSRGSP